MLAAGVAGAATSAAGKPICWPEWTSCTRARGKLRPSGARGRQWTRIWTTTCSTGRTDWTASSGWSVPRLAARQHPDLTRPSTLGPCVASSCTAAVDGVISAICGAFFLLSYLGSVPFPVSALISGLLNAALVWAALQWTASLRLAALPLWTWLVTVWVHDVCRSRAAT